MALSGTAMYEEHAGLGRGGPRRCSHWLEHPRLRTAEIRISPAAASIVGTYIG
jgi:hypothetical protein